MHLRALLVPNLGALLTFALAAQHPVPSWQPQHGPTNEGEVAAAPPVPVTWLPGSRDGDTEQEDKARAAAKARVDLQRQLRVPGMFRTSAGVRADGDAVHGAGADYKVTFTNEGAVYTPALPRAPHNYPVTFRTVAFGRGAATTPVSAPALALDDCTVHYTRPEFVEKWHVRADGCKQSFLFDHLPAGDGDLVVRMQLTTELAPRVDGPDAMTLQLDGIGGVTIEDVLGFDAAGTRIQGSMAFDGAVLELRLPDDAVDRAVLPLVLDPIVGTTLTVVGSPDNTYDPDVAYDELSNVFLVVFTRQFSATDYDIHGQRVNLSGALSGGLVLIENSGGTIDVGGRVSTINSENTFLVVWRRDNGSADDIYGRAVRASDAALSAASTILVTSLDNLISPDVGGETSMADNEGILVWHDATTGEINAKQVSVTGGTSPALPTLAPFTTVVLIGDVSASWTNSLPAISEGNGDTGFHCIVWMRQFTSSANTTVRAAIVNRNLLVLENFLSVTSTATDNDNPDVDGNGRNWIVAWDREATTGNGDPGVIVRAIGWDPNAAVPSQGYFLTGDVVVEDDLGDPEFTPAVAWTGEGAFVAYVDTAIAPDDDIYATLLDLYTCAPCRSTQYVIDGSSDDSDTPSICSARSGGENNVRCLIAHRFNDITTPPAGSNPDIHAIRFDADEGSVANLGGGCGVGGTMGVSCAISPNPAFAFRLFGAAPSATSLLVLSPTTFSVGCGSCALIANPFTGFVAATGTTDALGNDSFGVPVPASVIGVVLAAQWIVAGSNCFGGFDFSNAVTVGIQ